MNKCKQLLIATSLSCLVASAAAQTTLIGGAIGNGNFETTTATGTDDGSFSETPSWELFSGSSSKATKTNLGSTSPIDTEARNALLDVGNIAWTSRKLHVNRISISEGDQFQISFDWLDASNWDDANNEIQVYLYTTSAGAYASPQQEIGTITAGLSSVNGEWESYTSGILTAGALNDGKNIHIQIQGIGGGGTTTGFARFDNFQLTAIPEHGTSALIGGMLALGVVMVRRRR